ncbi:MAG: prepilin-type N-terminal cleavage/methylation domain-containing protein [Candidatus Spechtbacteria bacterium]|nr:prepilin-type N-terminal cleavage/methylation domain-containing protein [Candidatus Spechtbacteria bacterium]
MKGFSLLEIIIAIAVLGSGIAGAIALINQTVVTGVFAQKQLIGAHLAQEGVEVMHNIRNTNWIKQNSDPAILWDGGLTDGNSCVNFNSASLSDAGFAAGSCDSPAQRTLYFLNNRYIHSPTGVGSATNFFRYISIAHGVDSDAKTFVRLTSTVSWDKGSISVEEVLYDWR